MIESDDRFVHKMHKYEILSVSACVNESVDAIYKRRKKSFQS